MSQKGQAIPETQTSFSTVQTNKYPNSFFFGCFCGVVLNMSTRMASFEPLHARPFSYLQTGLSLGFLMFYYDYWRRRAVEEVMYGEEKMRYHMTLKAFNQVRVGEEEDITNLVEYLSNSSVRE